MRKLVMNQIQFVFNDHGQMERFCQNRDHLKIVILFQLGTLYEFHYLELCVLSEIHFFLFFKI